MAQNNRKLEGSATVGEGALPILAAAALQSAGATDDNLKALINELLSDAVEKRRKEKQRQERLAEQAVRSIAEHAAIKEAAKSRCSHRKQDGSTRLAGQRLSNGQEVFVCQFCQSEFHNPPASGQSPIPPGLRPPQDEIGG
jgi:hypothetical protein